MLSDSVYVTGIEFEASHGYTAAERKLTRRFRCSIELTADLAAASRRRRLQDSIDYRVVSGIAVEIGTTRMFKLIEALAGAIADAIHDKYPAAGLIVTVEKLSPPCPGAPTLSGVRIHRAARPA